MFEDLLETQEGEDQPRFDAAPRARGPERGGRDLRPSA